MATKLLPSEQTLRIAVFGCDALVSMARVPVSAEGIEFVAVADHNLGGAQRVADALGVANVYGSLKEMLEEAECEAVFVGGPPERQGWAIVRVLMQDKYVLAVEPSGIAERDACSIVRAARRSRGAFAVGYQHTLEVERSLQAPKLGGRADRDQLAGSSLESPPPPYRAVGDELGRRFWVAMRALGLAPAGIVVLDQVDGLFGVHHAFAHETGEVFVKGKLPNPDADRLQIDCEGSGASLELPLTDARQGRPAEITIAELLDGPSVSAVTITIGGPDASWEVQLSRHSEPDLAQVALELIRPGQGSFHLGDWTAPLTHTREELLAAVSLFI